MSIVRGALAVLDQARALLDDVGLRPYSVSVRTTRWSGATRIGEGIPVITETDLEVFGGRRPKVRQLSSKEIVAQGGSLDEEVFEIGPYTPVYDGGGMEIAALDPAKANDPQEVEYILKGPGMPENGAICQKVGDKVDSPFRLMMTIRRTGKNA